jgi:hypothetical protein
MAVQAVFMDEVGQVRGLRYIWSEDRSLLLALDCVSVCDAPVMTFADLATELNTLCWWQLREPVMIGLTNAIADVLTLYHAFEFAQGRPNTLMLVSTPPDEYFEALAA